MYSDNLEYAQTRLNKTLVRVGEEPFYIREVDDWGDGVAVEGYFYKSPHIKQTFLVGELNLEPVPLGYVNYEGGAYYLSRKNMREDWRQGLRQGNMFFIGPEGFFDFPIEPMRDTILNNYPSFQEAVKYIEEEIVDQVAFSRRFALGRGKRLMYKGRVVGTYDKLAKLSEAYIYLTEYLNEVMEGVKYA